MFKNKDYSESFRVSHYRELLRRFCGVKEGEEFKYSMKGKRVKEQLVSCIWTEQLLKKDKLYTKDGLRIEIISSGIWNLEEGPDFKDVEIHVCSGDWTRHGHSKQKEYDNVYSELEGKLFKVFKQHPKLSPN